MQILKPFEYSCPEITDLAARSFYEFSDVADYVWKSPRFLEHETKLELLKLDHYFPQGGKTAAWRWQLESRKLSAVFPYLMATGNLYCAASLFEIYLSLLIEVLQQNSPLKLSSIRGRGTNRLFEYLKQRGVKIGAVPLHAQIDAAIRIRNCLVHAGGLLENSRDRKELQRIQMSGGYLSPEHRKRRKEHNGNVDEVSISNGTLGEKIEIDNHYSYLVVSYFRDYFIGLCDAADQALGTASPDIE